MKILMLGCGSVFPTVTQNVEETNDFIIYDTLEVWLRSCLFVADATPLEFIVEQSKMCEKSCKLGLPFTFPRQLIVMR